MPKTSLEITLYHVVPYHVVSLEVFDHQSLLVEMDGTLLKTKVQLLLALHLVSGSYLCAVER